MEDKTKGRLLILLLVIYSSVGFGYLFFTLFVNVPILYIYTVPVCLYIPVMTMYAFILSLKDNITVSKK